MKPSTQIIACVPVFVDHPVVMAKPEHYVDLIVDARKVLQEWRQSLLAHELLDTQGAIKPDDRLNEGRREKRAHARRKLDSGEALEKPILGIGIFDTIEIGSGSDTLALLVLEGYDVLPVHVRKSQAHEFKGVTA